MMFHVVSMQTVSSGMAHVKEVARAGAGHGLAG